MVLQSGLKAGIINDLLNKLYSIDLGDIAIVTSTSGALDTVDFSKSTDILSSSTSDAVTQTIQVNAGDAIGETFNAIALKDGSYTYNICKHTDVVKTNTMFIQYKLKTTVELVN